MRLMILLVIGAAAAAQSNPEVLFRQDFESENIDWMVMGSGGSVKVTHEAGAAHSGSGALLFTYALKAKAGAAAVLPAPRDFERMSRIRFWAKADRNAPMAVLLSERKPGGGNYTAWFWAPKDVWQQVELAPADFVLSDGPTDPKDTDNKLDLDQVEGLGLLDLGHFFAGNPAAAQLGLAASGEHSFWIDDFEVLAGPVRPTTAGLIDGFDRGFLQWITLGTGTAKLAGQGSPLGEPAVEVAYTANDERVPLITRSLGNFDLSKAKRIAFDIASEQDATIAVSLELKGQGGSQGPRFNLPVYPPARREVFHVELQLSEFQGQGTLGPSLLKSILLLDGSAGGGGELGKNTIWIGNLRIF